MSVVCHGTQNGLSSTGSQENQYNLIKERYDGCEIIMGNLEITQIESDWDFSFLKVKNKTHLSSQLICTCNFYRQSLPLSFLQTIREVTGYVLIAMNHFQEIPLGKLRVVRGNSLYERRFALSVFFNYPKDGSSGLQQLGLSNLTGKQGRWGKSSVILGFRATKTVKRKGCIIKIFLPICTELMEALATFSNPCNHSGNSQRKEFHPMDAYSSQTLHCVSLPLV